MMIPLLQQRRSIRKFTKRPVEKEKRDLLIESLLRSPSSRSLNPWDFIIVTQYELLAKLSESKPHGAAFLKNAPLGIVVCADPAKSDVWIEDCSIASIIVQLTAESIGLASCWIQIRNRSFSQDKSSESIIRDILKLPENYTVESIIAIGYPDEKKPPHSKKSLEYHKVYDNTYGQIME